MGFFRGLLFALMPSLVLWAMLGVVAHRTLIYVSTPATPLLAEMEQAHRIN